MKFCLRTAQLICFLAVALPSWSAEPTAEQFATAIVEIDSVINPDGRTVTTLGARRSGSGIVLDAEGLIVTVGYLLLEATQVTVSFYNGSQLPANILSVDSSSGLALLRIVESQISALPDVRPLRPGKSSSLMTGERVIAMPAGGLDEAASVTVHSVKEFSAPWEYLLEQAIYTSPPVRNFSGAALINRDAELIGIGTLALHNITGTDDETEPGNVFIPIDVLTERLGALLMQNASARAWLGVMVDQRLAVTRVLEESPAARAGIQRGDTIVGFNNTHVLTRGNLYRLLWSGIDTESGSTNDKKNNTAEKIAHVLVARDSKLIPLEIATVDRTSWLTQSP